MLFDKYKKYKNEYNEYIIFIKSGNFYLTFNKDAYVLHNVFSYKIKETKNGYKSGFPLNAISKVEDKLKELNINYIIIQEDNIKKKQDFKKNTYLNYVVMKNYSIIYKRIDMINNILKENIDNNIEDILSEIEGVLCKIN